MQFKRVAVDTSKAVFTIHGVDEEEHPIVRRDLNRSQFQSFFSKLSPTMVVMEACGGSHHWGRVLTGMGHVIRLIPPQYVKPFVRKSPSRARNARKLCAPNWLSLEIASFPMKRLIRKGRTRRLTPGPRQRR
jgi:transposase